jgi:hypothetical protein
MTPHGAELAIADGTVQQIADKLAINPPPHPHHGKTYMDSLEDGVGLAEDMIHEEHLRNVNLYIFTDSPAHTDCPYGLDYETEAKELMAEGNNIYIADLHTHIYNKVEGAQVF